MSEKENYEMNGTEIENFTLSDEEIEGIRQKYENEITLVLQIGRKDEVPVVSVKVAGADKRHQKSGEKLGEIILKWIMSEFDRYANK